MRNYQLEDVEVDLIKEFRRLPKFEQEAIRTAVIELALAHTPTSQPLPENVVPFK